MLDYSLTHWFTFATAAAIVVATPGPDLACILGRTMRGGQKAGLAALVGMCAGAAIQVMLVTLGLGTLISSSAIALTVLKWVGAAYLVYLGAHALLPKVKGTSSIPDVAQTDLATSFRQGVFVNLFNPKAILFYIAFLPQFVEAGKGTEELQLAVHGGFVIVLAILVYLPVIFLAHHMSTRSKGDGHIGAVLERCTGVALIALGAKVAISS